jgi:integrase
MLAESGARVHEVCMLKWDDLAFDSQGIVVSVKSTKVNKIRTVRLRDAVPYISAWKAVYPHYSPSAHVFITQRGTTLIYELVRSTIARIARDAGVKTYTEIKDGEDVLKTHVTPHLFRHGRVTELLRMGMHEPELKKSLWGSVSTKMLERYEHLAGVDIDSEYKRILGLEDGEKTKPMLPAPIQCQNCSTVNEKGSMFCKTCGLPMSEKARVQVQSDEQRLWKEYLEFKKFQEAQKNNQ